MPYKNILVFYNGYVSIKDSKYVKVNSVNPLYLIINKVDGYFEEIKVAATDSWFLVFSVSLS